MTKKKDTSTDNIGLHLKNIYAEGELNEISTTEDFSVVQQEGSREVSRMQAKLPQFLPNNMLKMNLKNIALFKTACLNQTLTKK